MSESERLNGKEINEHRWSDSVRARIDELRRTVECNIERFNSIIKRPFQHYNDAVRSFYNFAEKLSRQLTHVRAGEPNPREVLRGNEQALEITGQLRERTQENARLQKNIEEQIRSQEHGRGR